MTRIEVFMAKKFFCTDEQLRVEMSSRRKWRGNPYFPNASGTYGSVAMTNSSGRGSQSENGPGTGSHVANCKGETELTTEHTRPSAWGFARNRPLSRRPIVDLDLSASGAVVFQAAMWRSHSRQPVDMPIAAGSLGPNSACATAEVRPRQRSNKLQNDSSIPFHEYP